MPRKPNYDFERKERERLKSLKKAARAEAKRKPDTDEAATSDDRGNGNEQPVRPRETS